MTDFDQEFDFDNYDSKPAKKNKDSKKNKKKEEEDFFDLDDQYSSKPSKLPVINTKPSKDLNNNNSTKNVKPSKNIYDDYEEIYEEVEEVNSPKKKSLQKKDVQESNYYQELEDIEQIKPKNQSGLPKIGINNSKGSQEEEFYEEIEEIKPPPRQQKKAESKKVVARQPQPQPEYQQNYQQNFDEDYGQDFQEQVKQQVPKKSNTSVNLKAKDKNVRESSNKAQPKKYAVNTNQIFTNKNAKEGKAQPAIPKQPQKQNKFQTRNASKKTIERGQPAKQIQRSLSRKSLKSNDSRSNIGNSRVTKKYNTDFTSNKHIFQVERSFPDDQQKLGQMKIERLAKLNEQVRDMIRRFNEELNQLINKNMILLKDKPVENNRNSDDKVRVLQQQLKSGATALEVIQNQYERLKDREGELKEEEYLLIMEKKIDEIKEKKRETEKVIHQFQVDVNSKGNKLSRKDVEKEMAQRLHQIKTMLIQTKKEEEKHEIKLQKLDVMMEELSGKNSDKEYQLSQQQDLAKQKGVVLHFVESIMKKHQEQKKKVKNTQQYCKSLQSLYKGKGDNIQHQNDQIKIAIRNVESQIKNLCHTLQHSQDQSLKVIRKSKENPKLGVHVGQTLDKILKSIEQSQNNNYFDVRSQGNKSQASERPLKKSMYENMNKDKQTRNNSSRKQPSPAKAKTENNDQINLMKPNFMKKKGKNIELHKQLDQQANQLYERVWSQEEQTRKGLEEKRKEEEERKKQEERIKEQEKKKEEENRKKPFVLKKNKLKAPQEKSIEVSPERVEEPKKLEIEPPVFEPKQEEKPSVGPKFTRFSKRGENKIVIPEDKPEEKQQPKKVEEPIIKEQPKEEEAIFKPKRFNLRNKIEKKDESYVPTVEAKKQQKKQQIAYEPKKAFKDEDVYKIPENKPVFKNPQPEVKQEISEEPQIKPRFSLKLKDRQKKENNENAGYMPTRNAEPENKVEKSIESGYNPSKRDPPKEQAKISIKLSDKNSQPTNPYAPKEPVNNPYASAFKKQQAANPYAPSVKKEQAVVNPYAPKEDAPRRQKEGPVKKIKVSKQAPKQKFNIYEQVEDLTEPAAQPIAIEEPVSQKPQINLAKTDELDLNLLLGKEKKKDNNEYNDLLGEVKVDKKKKEKKGGNDFFNDLLLD